MSQPIVYAKADAGSSMLRRSIISASLASWAPRHDPCEGPTILRQAAGGFAWGVSCRMPDTTLKPAMYSFERNWGATQCRFKAQCTREAACRKRAIAQRALALKRCRDDAGRSRNHSRLTGVPERVCLHAGRKPDWVSKPAQLPPDRGPDGCSRRGKGFVEAPGAGTIMVKRPR